MADGIVIRVNGETRRAPAGATLGTLLAALELAPAKVAVERNRAIVPRSAYGETPLADGDEVEIVAFVGGG